MKISWNKREKSKKLILFFGGFATCPNLLKCMVRPECDVAMFYDYRNFDCEIPKEFFEYDCVDLVAWSFGVYVADFLSDRLPKINSSIALCGSLEAVHDDFGIPRKVFEQTIDGLNEKTFSKFLSRVYADIKDAELYEKIKCGRTIDQLKDELIFLGKNFDSHKTKKLKWGRVIASYADKIFPIRNLKNFYGQKLEIIEGEHFPYSILKNGLDSLSGDRSKISKAFSSSFSSYEKAAVVQKKSAEHLIQIIDEKISAKENVKRIFEIGCGTGFLTKNVTKVFRTSDIILNDLFFNQRFEGSEFLMGDAEIIRFPKDIDLIVSSSSIQWIKNFEAFVLKVKSALSEGGVFAFSTFLPRNLKELRSITGKGLDYKSSDEILTILQNAGFEILHFESNLEDLYFDSPKEVLKHIKDTGVNGIFSEFWTPKKMRQFSDEYEKNFSSSKGLILTYEPAYFVAGKK